MIEQRRGAGARRPPAADGPAADPGPARAARGVRGRARLRAPAHPRGALRPLRAGRWPTTGRRPRSTARPARASTSRMSSCAACWGARRPTRADVIGVGMGLAAPVDAASGHAYVEGILPGWSGLRPAAEMEARLGLPVKLENDANVGALGEHRFGAARGARDIAYVRLSAGIGLGLVLNGVPYRGRLGIAGELGHVRAVADGGALCRCGQPRVPGDDGERGGGGRRARRPRPARGRARGGGRRGRAGARSRRRARRSATRSPRWSTCSTWSWW